MTIDFRAETAGGLVLLYAETERAETYADIVLVDEDHQEDEWSGGIPFGREHGQRVINELEDQGFSIDVD